MSLRGADLPRDGGLAARGLESMHYVAYSNDCVVSAKLYMLSSPSMYISSTQTI